MDREGREIAGIAGIAVIGNNIARLLAGVALMVSRDSVWRRSGATSLRRELVETLKSTPNWDRLG